MARAISESATDGQVRLPFTPMLRGQVIVGIISIAVMGWILSWPVGAKSLVVNGKALLDIAAIVFFPLVGYAMGVWVVEVHDRRIVKGCGLSVSQVQKLSSGEPTKEGYFLIIIWLMIAAYALGYGYAVWKFAQSAPESTAPVSFPVALITGVTIGALAFFAVRYAAYVRTTKLLDAALINLPKHQGIIDYLRESVFRGEQLYEPPGSLFVTIGITATFLGLSAALVNLDLPGLLQLSNQAGTANPDAAAAALRSFVGCMGLALGVSMLGVMTAVAAQWLRGHGAERSTEELLVRARVTYAELVAEAAEIEARIAAAEAASGGAGGSTAGPGPGPGQGQGG